MEAEANFAYAAEHARQEHGTTLHTVTGLCPRCKTERQLTVLIGGLHRCGFCSLLLRAETVHSTVERIDRAPGEGVESAP